MRIAVDLRPLQSGHAKRGIGKYLKNMLPELFRLGKEHNFIAYIWRGIPIELDLASYPNVEVLPVGFGLLEKFDKVLQYRRARHIPLRYLARVKADVFFQPDVSYDSISGVPTAVVLYDLIPLLFEKEYFSFYIPKDDSHFFAWKMRDRYAKIMRRFAKVQHIVSISKASLSDLHRFDQDTKKIKSTITPLAAQALPKPAPKSLIDSPYFFYVGGNDHRKNVAELIEDFAQVVLENPKSDVKLVLAGNDFGEAQRGVNPVFWNRLESSDVKSRVILMGYVDDEKLATLYKYCLAFVFASRYEGFGLPILEAMRAHAPVIALNNSSIPEVAGDSAVLVKNRKEFVSAMSRLLNRPSQHERLVATGLKQAKRFTWEGTAHKTLEAIELTARNSARS